MNSDMGRRGVERWCSVNESVRAWCDGSRVCVVGPGLEKLSCDGSCGQMHAAAVSSTLPRVRIVQGAGRCLRLLCREPMQLGR